MFLNIFFFFIAVCFVNNYANEIIFSQRFTADPAPLVYKGRVYVYCSHDKNDQHDWNMVDYTCLSSDDMINWTDHGEVFDVRSTKWHSDAWACQVVERNDIFYLYWSCPGKGIGVAVSSKPEGPFREARPDPLITLDGIDPTILIDDDGQAYIYWPGPHIYKLSKDMIHIEGEEINVNIDDQHEASYITHINGKYQYSYMSFQSWEEWGEKGKLSDFSERYVIGDSPTGPFRDPKGTRESRTMLWPVYGGGNTQPGVFCFNGKYYSFYHSNKLAILHNEELCCQRNIGLDRLYVNSDGTYKMQTITEDGLRQLKYVNPYKRNEAEAMAGEEGINTEPCSDKGGGRDVYLINSDDWIRIAGVDFGLGGKEFEARICADSAGGKIEIRLDKADGPVKAAIDVPNTGGFQTWRTIKKKINGISGIHDLFFRFEGKNFHFNWWSFSGGKISGAIPPPVVKSITIWSKADNKYLSADNNFTLSEDTSSILSDKNKFILYDNEDGTYSLMSSATKKYLSYGNNQIISVDKDSASGDAEKLGLYYVNGYYCICSAVNQKYIKVPLHSGKPILADLEKPWEKEYRDVSRFKIEYIK
ncbi:MAG: carbohydrate-binding protein [Ignavibacteriaceae bacterium]